MLQRCYPTSAAVLLLIGPVLVLAFAGGKGGQSSKSAPTDASAKLTTDAAAFQATVQPFFARHCFSCHGGKHEKGEVRLDQFADDASLTKGVATLEKARAMLARRA